MGYWNQGVYGGDLSLSWRERVYLECNSLEYGDDHKEIAIPSAILSSKISDLVSIIESVEDEEDRNIGYQVLGASIVFSGCEMDDELRGRVMDACDFDDYAKDDSIRRNVMSNLKNIFKDYVSEKPINIFKFNFLEESEDLKDSTLQEMGSFMMLMKARIKKLEASSKEKSGCAEYDKGFADACEEEISYQEDSIDLLSKYEMLLDFIKKVETGSASGLIGGESNSGRVLKSKSSGYSGGDTMPG